MSEQQLRDFGSRAEMLVETPGFADLEREGRRLQVRRRVSVAAALAVVLAVAGVALSPNHRSRADHGPVNPPPPSAGASPYPGNP